MPDEQVTRSVDLESDVDEVWRAVADPGERALWLDDPDAAARRVRVDEVDAGGAADPGRRLTWTWWHPGDEGAASTVSVVLAPLAGGGTRVVVTESLPARPPAVRAQAGARATAALVRQWSHRLLGLELLFVAARAGAVAV
jgi:uncharacterized protein YndB with AHSA1/START domain